MRFSKILLIIVFLFSVSTTVYAVEISVGGSAGGGLPIVRGQDYADRFAGFMDLGYKYKRCRAPIAIVSQFDVMFQFIPYLALETGLGFKYSTEQLAFHNGPGTDPGGSDNNYYIWQRSQVHIPIMLRGQYEYELLNYQLVTYFSAGAKFGVPVFQDYILEGYTDSVWNENNQVKNSYKSSNFALDVAFALGQEFKIGTSHYVGFRFSYDMNVIRPYATSKVNAQGVPSEAGTMPDGVDLYHDDLTVALTYRYVIGR